MMKNVKAKNEVYGTLKLDVSIEVESNKEHMAKLEAEMKMDKVEEQGRILNVVDPVTGEIVATMKVHNAELIIENFFGEDE
ncbi:hypothetical protein [Sutcliffiella sp. NC1]|uniref:hypothetical protein n=1 Tax=Sutcliffiella sp. NC1 TaxID=3004096 RepID=UPI0022DE8878|nr:hypothetical protein [Sutcliffiella sp. NC1]WBL16396.1 hypothetical protein O1A01_07115 [Sutcliffiella sp. NC1]